MHASRVALQMWTDETSVSFAIEEAKIDGRKISYPYLLDAKGEPRLESTNAFMIWFCERWCCYPGVGPARGLMARMRAFMAA